MDTKHRCFQSRSFISCAPLWIGHFGAHWLWLDNVSHLIDGRSLYLVPSVLSGMFFTNLTVRKVLLIWFVDRYLSMVRSARWTVSFLDSLSSFSLCQMFKIPNFSLSFLLWQVTTISGLPFFNKEIREYEGVIVLSSIWNGGRDLCLYEINS